MAGRHRRRAEEDEDLQPELIVDLPCQTGESPHWHPFERKLYWLDIPPGRMYRYDPLTSANELIYEGEAIGGFTIQTDGALLLFMARGAIRLWRNGRLTTLIEEIPEERDTRFNDVAADPAGRVFCGTMPGPTHPASLYLLATDGSLSKVLGDISLSNGMGFTPDLRQLYHTDTRRYLINLYDYERETGAIRFNRVFARLPEGGGRPDGLVVDAEGCVWSGLFGGGCVVRFTPDGREDARITLPARNVTCPTFAGDDYADMYVTTGGGQDRAENGPLAGSLFRLRPPVRGVPKFLSDIRV